MKAACVILLLFLLGCSSDFEIMQDYHSVPVVYAVINPYDSIHYVRVQKTFKIHEKEDFAALNDGSFQYKNVDVYLYGELDDSVHWVRQFQAITVDKEEGLFDIENYQIYQLQEYLPIMNRNTDSLILEVIIHDKDIRMNTG